MRSTVFFSAPKIRKRIQNDYHSRKSSADWSPAGAVSFFASGAPMSVESLRMPSRRATRLKHHSRGTRSVIDVSHWEDPIDFEKVAADWIVAVVVKATH